jgi:thiol:disulfide interchange protein
MIPINLAIIGAGAKARSKADGFRTGGLYGLGMALAYGALGLAVVLTGSKFGTLNSSVWFNAAIAIVFVAMALAMFDVINVDLSRFGSKRAGSASAAQRSSLGKVALVFSMGVMAALLAGACVAPVVVSVLLLSTSLYAKGGVAGLLLPFLLGVGMALPWPFAGAGLAFLPKPGKWMKGVKYGFGFLIALFALYYAHIAWHVYSLDSAARSSLTAAPGQAAPVSAAADANREFVAALRQARAEGRPVFVDFHASWCKNCLAMDETVFNQPAVQQALKNFIVVRYDAEQPNQSPAREVLDYFGVMGLPSFLVVTAGK